MKKIADIVIVIAVASVIVGIISKFLLVTPILCMLPNAFLRFASVCLLLAIALLLRGK